LPFPSCLTRLSPHWTDVPVTNIIKQPSFLS
jgi:hypothetical protein